MAWSASPTATGASTAAGWLDFPSARPDNADRLGLTDADLRIHLQGLRRGIRDAGALFDDARLPGVPLDRAREKTFGVLYRRGAGSSTRGGTVRHLRRSARARLLL